MNWKPRLSTFLIVIIAIGEIFAIPIIINENVVFEVINPIEETTAKVIPHHQHRHRHHRHHGHHKKRRSLNSKPEQESPTNGRRNKQMMLTKPYWPWP